MATTVQKSLEQYSRSRNLFIQMSGAPGSAKSTTATLLQQTIGGLVIDHEIIRSSLLEDGEAHFDQTTKRAYRLQWEWAKEAIKQGHNVIINSPCNFEEVLNKGHVLAAQYDFDYWYVECKVEDIRLLDERLRARDPMRSQRTAVDQPPVAVRIARQQEDSHTLFEIWIKNPCRPERHVIIIDSTNTPQAVRDDIVEQITKTETPISYV